MPDPTPRALWAAPDEWSPPGWVEVDGRLSAAPHYWIATASTHAEPHSTPVEGLWWEGSLWIGDIAGTRRSTNLVANHSVAAHLPDTASVVILRGDAQSCDDLATKEALAAANTEKYGLAFPPHQARWFEIRPTEVLTWDESSLATTGTRWTF